MGKIDDAASGWKDAEAGKMGQHRTSYAWREREDRSRRELGDEETGEDGDFAVQSSPMVKRNIHPCEASIVQM
jgi:hypothetical protein